MFLVGCRGISVSGSAVAVGAVAASATVLARVGHLGTAAAAVAVAAGGVAVDNGQEAFAHNCSWCALIRFGQVTCYEKNLKLKKNSLILYGLSLFQPLKSNQLSIITNSLLKMTVSNWVVIYHHFRVK